MDQKQQLIERIMAPLAAHHGPHIAVIRESLEEHLPDPGDSEGRIHALQMALDEANDGAALDLAAAEERIAKLRRSVTALCHAERRYAETLGRAVVIGDLHLSSAPSLTPGARVDEPAPGDLGGQLKHFRDVALGVRQTLEGLESG